LDGAYSASVVTTANASVLSLTTTATAAANDLATKTASVTTYVTSLGATASTTAYDAALAALDASDESLALVQNAQIAAAAAAAAPAQYTYADYTAGRLLGVDKTTADNTTGTIIGLETQAEADLRAKTAYVLGLTAPTTVSVAGLYTDYTNAVTPIARATALKEYTDALAVLTRTDAEHTAAVAGLVAANTSLDAANADNVAKNLAVSTQTTALGVGFNPSIYGGLKDAVSASAALNNAAQADLANATLVPTGATILTGVAATTNTASNAKAAARALLGTSTATDNTFEVEIVRGLNNEETQRVAADVVLGGRITTETTERKAADVALGGRIDSANTRITILTEQVKKDIATATAVAVALGGNSFLPGKKFNLTVNVGSYDGESALAAQFGFMVNDSLAINGGVASGFGSGSSTAVRGGFTYGW
jgi:hypothetical protein